MELLTLEQLKADVKEYVSNYEVQKLIDAEEIMKDDSLDITERINRIKGMPADVTESDIFKSLVQVVLFEGKMYQVPPKVQSSTGKKTVSRIIGGGKFHVGQSVRLQSGTHESEIYRVGEDNLAYNSENRAFKPSILTELFHVEELGRTESLRGMAGFSHNYWVAVE